VARKPSRKDLDALDGAQQLIYDAWEAPSARQRASLAHTALSISPLCADAYVILAGVAENGSDEELLMWRKGVEAGERALGKQGFEDYAGHFWGFHETRPYMRARAGLAEALWGRGAHDEAISHLQAMLELNPNDNQGIQYILAMHLVEAGRDDALASLLKRYKEDDSPYLRYSAALSAFRREGDSPAARALLQAAIEANLHVPAYITGTKRTPKTQPEFYSPGNDDEAVLYAQGAAAGWASVSGAISWLALHALKPKERKAAKKKRSG
jgi:tetratricopeptide (TPR) repeat protein